MAVAEPAVADAQVEARRLDHGRGDGEHGGVGAHEPPDCSAAPAPLEPCPVASGAAEAVPRRIFPFAGAKSAALDAVPPADAAPPDDAEPPAHPAAAPASPESTTVAATAIAALRIALIRHPLRSAIGDQTVAEARKFP